MILLPAVLKCFHQRVTVLLCPVNTQLKLIISSENATLSCNYSGSANYLCWYQQKSGSSPQLLIGEYSEKIEKLSTRHDKQSNEFHLEISSAALTDSAVYYCALQPQ
uniref:Ig-like domain-containing protein n=1 Tax=Labrus bergylta TaxID=56723 RepID=A0A3Q3FGF2_9LABR